MKQNLQAATSRRRSATSAARSDTGGNGIAHGNRNERGSKSGNEVAAVETEEDGEGGGERRSRD